MPTQAELDDYGQAKADVATLAVAALVAYWLERVAHNPTASLDDLRKFLMDNAVEYGQAAAATTLDFYASIRPPGPAFSPTPVVRADLIDGPSLNWSTSDLLGEDWEKALDKSAAVLVKAGNQAAIETMGEATAEDPLKPRFARFPHNDDPCAYCVLRASRGAVYWSEATAERGDHLKCKCEVTPVFPGEQLPYLRKPYMAQYLAGASEAEGDMAMADPGKARTKALLSGMRRANGTR